MTSVLILDYIDGTHSVASRRDFANSEAAGLYAAGAVKAYELMGGVGLEILVLPDDAARLEEIAQTSPGVLADL